MCAFEGVNVPESRICLSLLALTLAVVGCSPARTAPAPSAVPPPTSAPLTTEPATAREDTQTILDRLGGYPCPDSDFTCVNLEVPVNHFDPANLETIEVVFGVLPASGERKGMFV